MTKRDEKKRRAMARSAARHAERMKAAGLPVVVKVAKEKPPKPVRRVSGLDWLMTRKPPRITRSQYEAGRVYGEICSEARRAEMPGKSGNGGGGRTDYGPTELTLAAIRRKRDLDNNLRAMLGEDADDMLRLLELVCHEGWTLREIAQGSTPEATKLEARLLIGLSLLRSSASHYGRAA